MNISAIMASSINRGRGSIMAKEITDKELRGRGYLTTAEFVDLLTPGLKEYMERNWGVAGKDALHHPEDLFSTASIYLEVALHVIGDFGVNGSKVLGKIDE